MSATTTPAVTISLVTWNGLRWLPGCLDSVASQTHHDYELLILDNGSTDGSVEWLRERAAADSRITLVESEVNLGYAPAHNRAIEAAQGAAVLLLNQDVELDPGFLEATTAVLAERAEVGSVQARLRRLSQEGERTDQLDTTGLVMHRDRRAVSRDQLAADSGPDRRPAGPVWGVDGAAPVYRRRALEMARLPASSGGSEVLDEDFFAYKEDVDLAWRLRRLGWTAWYEPRALAWHARGGGDTGASGWREVIRANMSNPPRVRALSWRNQRLMQVKNEEPGRFLRDLPWIAWRELRAWAFMVLADPRRLAAVPELWVRLPAAGRKRRALGRTTQRARPGGDASRASRANLLQSRLEATRPVRLLRHLGQRGVRRTAERIVHAIDERWWLARNPAHLAVRVNEVEPRAIQGVLDRPRIGEAEVSDYLYVTGWAHSDAEISEARIYLDGEPVGGAHVGRSRPDVASTRRHLDQGRIAGLGAVLPIHDLETGPHVVSVVVSDAAGRVRVLARRFGRIEPAEAYRQFHERTMAEVAADAVSPPANPTTVLFVVLDDEAADLAGTLASVAGQTGARWQCAVVTADAHLAAAESTAAGSFAGSKPADWSVTDDLMRALSDPPDELRFVWFLEAGERLAPDAARSLAAAGVEADVVYSDHDGLDPVAGHVDPWFVPDWSPYRLLSQDYVDGAFAVSDGRRLREALAQLPSSVGAPAWRYGLLLAVSAAGATVVHVPRVLWSRPRDRSPVDEMAAARAVEATLVRQGVVGADVQPVESSAAPARRIAWPEPETSMTVSVIVPTTGRPDLAEGLLRMLRRTAYEPLEVIVLDNGRGRHPDGIASLRESLPAVITVDEPFNWARLSNIGAGHAAGDMLLFLNDDMEVIDEDWLHPLVRLAARPDVGAVGPLLLYPDGMIQHAGIILVGHGGGAAHLFAELDPSDDLYLDQQRITREVSALTGACLLVSREVYDEVGGFDERFVVSGNDTDFCLRIRETGRLNLWTPDSRLIHHEGRSRRGVAYLGDESRLWDSWSERLRDGDPYFNPNLAQDRLDCSLDASRLR